MTRYMPSEPIDVQSIGETQYDYPSILLFRYQTPPMEYSRQPLDLPGTEAGSIRYLCICTGVIGCQVIQYHFLRTCPPLDGELLIIQFILERYTKSRIRLEDRFELRAVLEPEILFMGNVNLLVNSVRL